MFKVDEKTNIHVLPLAVGMLVSGILLGCFVGIAIADAPYTVAPSGSKLEVPEGSLQIVQRDLLISNPGEYQIPDEQLHFPYLFESPNGIWYLTYREGPHYETPTSRGNRVQCVQSRDRGKTWLPWMGMKAEPWMYQFFVTRLEDDTLISYRCRMAGVHQVVNASGLPDGTTAGTAIILESSDNGAFWTRRFVPVTNMPCSDDSHLITLWGRAIQMPDGRLLWGIISREKQPTESVVGVAESTDGGKSFRFVSTLCHNVFQEVGEPREPGIELLPSGELVALIRCAPMIQVRSTDGGRTWSEPRKLQYAGMCPRLLLLENGVLVASYGTRYYMHIMASWDGSGQNWSEPLVVYKGQTGGYSNLQALASDRFRICYQEGTFNTDQPGGHRIVRLVLKVATANK